MIFFLFIGTKDITILKVILRKIERLKLGTSRLKKSALSTKKTLHHLQIKYEEGAWEYIHAKSIRISQLNPKGC